MTTPRFHLADAQEPTHPVMLKYLRGEELTAADHAVLRAAGIAPGDAVLVEYPDTPEAQHMRSLIDRRLGYGEPLTPEEEAELDAWRQRLGRHPRCTYDAPAELTRQRELLDQIEALLAGLPADVRAKLRAAAAGGPETTAS